MEASAQQSSDLFRRTVVELAELPDADLASVVEFVAELKRHNLRPQSSSTSSTANEILALARARVEEMRTLPREQIMQRFNAAVEHIRAEAIANGTAITGEYYGD